MEKIIIVVVVAVSTMWYIYLHYKTHISLRFLYIDNLLCVAISACLSILLVDKIPYYWLIPLSMLIVMGIFTCLFLIRFYRVPFFRGVGKTYSERDVISPADGNVIYIKRVESNQIPCAVKNGRTATLEEIMGTGIMNKAVWMIGINMTPFDVHRNAAPISGKIELNQHINGEFRSLKDINALGVNERNTIVINHNGHLIGVVQTASRLVRRIVTYKQKGEWLEKGEWFGMIRFGSQVDLIIPAEWKVCVEEGQQIYAKETVVAQMDEIDLNNK